MGIHCCVAGQLANMPALVWGDRQAGQHDAHIVAWGAQGDVQHRAVLGHVQVGAVEHVLDLLLEVRLLCQLEPQLRDSTSCWRAQQPNSCAWPARCLAGLWHTGNCTKQTEQTKGQFGLVLLASGVSISEHGPRRAALQSWPLPPATMLDVRTSSVLSVTRWRDRSHRMPLCSWKRCSLRWGSPSSSRRCLRARGCPISG